MHEQRPHCLKIIPIWINYETKEKVHGKHFKDSHKPESAKYPSIYINIMFQIILLLLLWITEWVLKVYSRIFVRTAKFGCLTQLMSCILSLIHEINCYLLTDKATFVEVVSGIK